MKDSSSSSYISEIEKSEVQMQFEQDPVLEKKMLKWFKVKDIAELKLVADTACAGLVPIEEDDNYQLFGDLYEFKKTLGYGSFGFAMAAICKKSGAQMAVKMIKTEENGGSKKAKEDFENEVKFLESFDHPNVLKILDKKVYRNYYFICTELGQMSIRDFIKLRLKEGVKITDEETRQIMKSLCEGVNYLHEKCNLIHRDLKPRNVVLMNPEKDLSDLRIIDFGVACFDDFDNKRSTKKVGTLTYQPPEFVIQEGYYEYDQRTDMWSIGVIMYELMQGSHPFLLENMTEKDVIAQLIEFRKQGYAQVLSEDLQINKVPLDMLKRLLHTKRSQRMRSKEAVLHPFITGAKIDENTLGLGNAQNVKAFQFDCYDLLKKAIRVGIFCSVVSLKQDSNFLLADDKKVRKYKKKLAKHSTWNV